MQADEFEKKIKNKMEEFELVPDSAVWKEVSLKIEKEKKKRRVLIYWLFTGFLLLSGASGWWFINNNENNKDFVKNDIEKNALKIENYKRKPDTNVFSRNFNKVDKVEKKIARTKKVEEENVSSHELENHSFTKIISPKVVTKAIVVNNGKSINDIHNTERQPSKSLPLHKFYNPGLATKTEDETSQISQIINEKSNFIEEKQASKSLPLHKFYNPALATKTKDKTSLLSQIINEKPTFKKDTIANTIVKNTTVTKKVSGKKFNIGFTVFTGISNNISGFPIVEKNYNAALDYLNSPNASGGYSYSDTNISNNFKKGFSYGFGVFIKTPLAKKISLSAEVNYHLYTAKTTVGSKVNQQASFYDSSVEKDISVSEYFSPGGSVNYLNKYHFLQLPLNFWYRLNKNQQKPLLVSAGISPGFLISSNALHANNTANVYYIDKQQFSHFQLSAQIGFSFPITGSSKFLLSAEPIAQYSFTNASKAAADAKQHLFFTGIKASIILK